MQINKIISALESCLDKIDLKKEEVSHSSVGWQINHILIVSNSICKVLIKSKPENYTSAFNWQKTYVLLTGYIPRGKVRAPKAVVSEEYSLESIKEAISNAKSLIKRIQSLDKNAYFEHPFLGNFNLKDSKRFIEVHSVHHLKIIRNIIA